MILDDIVAYKRTELAAQKQQVSLMQLQDLPLFHRHSCTLSAPGLGVPSSRKLKKLRPQKG